MIKVCYSELDGPKGLSLRLEAAGHAGYAPAGQDIVCAGASTLMQALVYLLAGEENARSDAWDEPEGPRLAVAAQAPVAPSDAAARDAGAGRLPPCPLRGCHAYHGTDRGAGRGGAGAAARRASAGKRPAPRCCGFGTAGRSRYDPRPAGSLGAPCAARCTN